MISKSTKKLATMVVALLGALLLTWMPYWSPTAAAAEPEIAFTSDYQENLTGDLVPGGTFKVSYDSDRLTCARGEKYGQPVWNILAYVQFSEDSEPSYLPLETPGEDVIMTQEFDIPSDATELIMWFYNNDGINTPCYDSDYGANYHFPVTTKISFTSDFEENVEGPLVPGGTFKVSYDSQRLTCNRDTRYGQPNWSIYAYAQFAEDAEPEYKVLQPFAEEGILTGEFDIPSDAQEVVMWFYNWGYYTGFQQPQCYDSDNGANYHFPLN